MSVSFYMELYNLIVELNYPIVCINITIESEDDINVHISINKIIKSHKKYFQLPPN